VIAHGEHRPSPFATLGLAAGLAVLLGDLVNRIAPLHGFAPWVIGNDLAAAVGAAWSVVQMVFNRRTRVRLVAWSQAALGMTLLLVENHLENVLAQLGSTEYYAGLSALLWIAAAYLCFACARRFAMHRYVMAVMRTGFALALVATGMAFFVDYDLAADSHMTLQGAQELLEFLSVLLFTAAMMLMRFAPLKSYSFQPAELGRRARSLQRDFALERRRKYPTVYPVLALPGFSHLLIVIHALWCAVRAAPAAARDGGRSVAGQMLDMLRLGFTQGIDAKSYYVLGLYRARTPNTVDQTMTRVETKNGLTRAVQNLREHTPLPREMGDKVDFWRICEKHGIPSAPILASVERGKFTNFEPREQFDRDLFVKVRRGRGGHGTLNFARVSPYLYRDDAGVVRDLEVVQDHLRAMSATRDLIVQPKLANHPSIASLADKSLIVFRVVTCLDRRDEPQVTHGILRVLRRFEPDWPGSPDSDWGCAIDLRTGVLGMMTGDAPATCTRWFADHPLTGERVFGRRLAGWTEIAKTALDAHRVFRGRILIGWDIGWTPEGVRILEGNSSLDVSYFQRVYRTPVGRSPLAPLLNFHLDMLTERLLRDARS